MLGNGLQKKRQSVGRPASRPVAATIVLLPSQLVHSCFNLPQQVRCSGWERCASTSATEKRSGAGFHSVSSTDRSHINPRRIAGVASNWSRQSNSNSCVMRFILRCSLRRLRIGALSCRGCCPESTWKNKDATCAHGSSVLGLRAHSHQRSRDRRPGAAARSSPSCEPAVAGKRNNDRRPELAHCHTLTIPGGLVVSKSVMCDGIVQAVQKKES